MFTTTEPNYDDYSVPFLETIKKNEHLTHIRNLYIVMYFFICVISPVLNTYVIIASYRAYRRSLSNAEGTVWLQHTGAWVLSLAVTHLVFSGFLVLQLLYAWWHFNWHYSAILCKLSSYVFYFSMFSTAALLSLWSVNSCVLNSKCFNALQCPKLGMSMVTAMVLSSWTFGAVFGSPSLLSRELRYTELGMECIDDYDLDTQKTTEYGSSKLNAVVLCRFLLGILVPMLVMLTSACIARRQGGNEKVICKRIACITKVAYFICWTPLLLMGLVQVKAGYFDSFKYGLPSATVLAAAHCFINPVVYLLVGRKINMEWMLQVPGQKRPQRDDTEL
ncbi:chemerin-like receptor 1 [Salminus brasiliensis]|uniref:chemerin-like receptor 1 n=1 Tax=Salminus brasiliensis TaxID=930266 RepID=UPI003B8372B1